MKKTIRMKEKDVAISRRKFLLAGAGILAGAALLPKANALSVFYDVDEGKVKKLTCLAGDCNSGGGVGGAVSSVFGRTGAVTAQNDDYTWAQLNKATSSIADITTRSHTSLTDIGTNTHAQIDTHLAASAPHSGHVKNTAGQTINVSTAAELTQALADLAAAPSLLGNVIIQLAAGTYSGNFTIPALLFNGFTLELKGTYSTVLGSTTATGGTSAIQPTVVKTGAGWTVNAYKNKIIKFTSGTNNNLFRLIDTNTTDTLTLCGEALTSAPQNGDTFEIYDWGTVIGASSGVAITANSVKGLKFTAIKFSGASAFNVITSDCIMTITECAFADINTIFGSPNTYVYHCLFLPKSGARTDHRMSNTSYYGCKWDLQENNSLGVLLRIGYTLVRNGCVVDGNNFALGWGIQIDNAGHCQFHIAGNIVRNCNVGIYVINGSGAMNQSVNVTYTNNVTNINVDTTSWSS